MFLSGLTSVRFLIQLQVSSYSGAVPNEKITWGKLDINTPKFIIESDATIVAPLMFEYILEN